MAIAEAEGLAPALGFVVSAARPRLASAGNAAPGAMPDAVRQRLRRRLTESTARQLVLSRELGRLLEAFDREHIPVIPLKGPALAEMLYPRPDLRPCTDLDLLIRREALVAVDGLLQRLGWRRFADAHSWRFDVTYDRATLYAGPGGVHLDLHWSLVSDPRFDWNEADGLTVWERAIKTPLAHGGALGLCPEDLLLYLAVHLAVHHGLAGLLWYWDLALLLDRWGSQLDWEALVARAARWRVRAALAFALLELERLFDARVPAAVLAAIEPRGPRAAALGWLLRHRELQQRHALEHLIALLLVDRGRDILRTLRGALLPSRAWLEARYDGQGASVPGYYLAHYRRVGEVLSQATRGLGSRVESARRSS